MEIKYFFDKETSTITYIVFDQTSKDAVVIDPVLNYNQASSTYDYKSVDEVMAFVENKNLIIRLIMETHVHADHLTGAAEIKRRTPGAKTVVGSGITEVQKVFKLVFNLSENFSVDGSQFDLLVSDGQELLAGKIKIKVIHTPGHTPTCCSYLIEGLAFTGDALFMPDFGVARCDFPGGDANELYNSVMNKLYLLPDKTRVFTGHDYQPNGRGLQYESTIGESKKNNIHINEKTTQEQFYKFRKARDKTLGAPKLLFASLEVNINAGSLPDAEPNGVSYLKIPIKPVKKGS